MARAIEKVDPALREFATERQRAYLDAIDEHGSIRAAARAMGVSYVAVHASLERVRKNAAFRGYSPPHDYTRPVPEGFVAKGVSTYYNKDGKPSGQWVKSAIDDERRQIIIREGFAAMAEELPRVAPLPFKGKPDARLCNVYTLTDAHVGALCWGKETGNDWDLKIAEGVLTGVFEKLIAASPPAATAIVAELGDFLHADGMLAATPTSGNLLDVDGRFSKVVGVAVRVLRRVVDMALARHKTVHVLIAEGNHDMTSSIWLRTMFAALYENEPRIQVIDSPLPYYAHQHGQTMLGWHHGHLRKTGELPLLFAAQFPAMWGACSKRYVHTGHRHHVEEREHSGVTVMQHSTLTGRDAYAARNGYINDRQVTAVTYHDAFGKHSTATICPEMLAAA